MNHKLLRCKFAFALAAVGAAALLAIPSYAQDSNSGSFHFVPNSLVLARSVYTGNASTVTVGETLPIGCVAGNVAVPLVKGGTVEVAVTCGMACRFVDW